MIGVTRYFKHNSSERISIYRAIQNDEVVAVTQGSDLSGDSNYTELTQSQYESEVASGRSDREAANNAAVQRAGVLDQLVNNADTLFGKILGGL